MPDYKNNQDEPRNEEDRRWNKVRAKMIYPPATDRWNGKHKRDDQDAFTIRDGKDASDQHQRKQTRYNKLATLISSTKGAPVKRRASAIRSCTVEKRRNLSRRSTGFIGPVLDEVSFI